MRDSRSRYTLSHKPFQAAHFWERSRKNEIKHLEMIGHVDNVATALGLRAGLDYVGMGELVAKRLTMLAAWDPHQVEEEV